MSNVPSSSRYVFLMPLLVAVFVVVTTSQLTGCDKRENERQMDVSKPIPWWQPLEPDVVIGNHEFYAGKCSITRVQAFDGVASEIDVFRAPSRPLASCSPWKGDGASLRHDGEYLILSVCQMAFGAGGCAVERYRSADFKHWEEHIGVTWINGEEYEAWRTLGSTSSKADSVKKVAN
ncbi:hypothetical protein LRP50_17985 [Enterovibrio sp. ZSDZ42]|uniref:Uncharacterized protein n=1 Tax=Enterovibrio gelatinilyticus TaxID=2899819 RepID=A0ABT5R428_9GAMM|nr:hypothetical protein [Enterovibrio sp. ZSDZ42]MDD1795023.1 hypothetical protein [Enterovibrio sp. ZSDZ42]